jgi:hypothetical protein
MNASPMMHSFISKLSDGETGWKLSRKEAVGWSSCLRIIFSSLPKVLSIRISSPKVTAGLVGMFELDSDLSSRTGRLMVFLW